MTRPARVGARRADEHRAPRRRRRRLAGLRILDAQPQRRRHDAARRRRTRARRVAAGGGGVLRFARVGAAPAFRWLRPRVAGGSATAIGAAPRGCRRAAATDGRLGRDGLGGRRPARRGRRRFDRSATGGRRGRGRALGSRRRSSASARPRCVRGSGSTAGLAVLTRRGGGSDGAAGLGWFRRLAAGFRPLTGGGRVGKRGVRRHVDVRAAAPVRSTNCRATTSSIVLDALFTSMPWSRLSSAITSWLDVLRSSATL